jgi:hypothetical protein
MQRKGITNPLPEIKRFCEEFVNELAALDPASEVTAIYGEHGETDFTTSGRILATIPPIPPDR